MEKVYLGLGTNLGNKEHNLYVAVRLINKRIGKVVSLSAFYETAPWGFSSENSFLNAACGIESNLSPWEILKETQAIEYELGRTTKSTDGSYKDRLIDIDLLLYGNHVLHTPELELPHPRMTERRFVMDPLIEIAPNVVHPVLGKKLKEICCMG